MAFKPYNSFAAKKTGRGHSDKMKTRGEALKRHTKTSYTKAKNAGRRG